MTSQVMKKKPENTKEEIDKNTYMLRKQTT